MREIQFLGDTFLDRAYRVDLELENFIFNLEYPISKRGTPAKSKVNLKCEKSYILETFQKKPLALNLANNHILDYSSKALADTIEFLERESIDYFGVNSKSFKFELGGKKVALFGYCSSDTNGVFEDGEFQISKLEIDSISKDIASIKEEVDFIILNFHLGDEEIKFPKPSDIKIARESIDLGADLIISHHSHIVESYEIYKNRYIFYGIGNAIFPNLNIESYFDGERFRGRYRKIQNRLNRESLVVTLNSDLEVSFYRAYFDGEVLKRDRDRELSKVLIESEKLYRLYKSLYFKYLMLKRFIKNPKIPSLQSLKYFLKSN